MRMLKEQFYCIYVAFKFTHTTQVIKTLSVFELGFKTILELGWVYLGKILIEILNPKRDFFVSLVKSKRAL